MTYPDPINCDLCDGELIIGSTSLHTEAWCCLEVRRLWLPVGTYEGEDPHVPGIPGDTPYGRELVGGRIDLRMIVSGYHDLLGNQYPNPSAGLYANLALIEAGIYPVTSGDGTRPADLILPGGLGTIEADVYATLKPGEWVDEVWRVALQLEVPAGRFS